MFQYAQALGEDRLRQPARRHHLGADARRGRRRAAARPPGVRLVLHPARRRRQRDDAQRDQPRDAGAHRASRPARDRGSPTSTASRTTAVEEIVRWATPGHPLPPHRHRGHRRRRRRDQGRRQGRDVVQLGQPRRARVRRPVRVRRHAARRNEQVGFGAGGPHFCLGANLARREITRDVRGDPHRACPTSRSPASPTTCRARSSTASSACPAPGSRPTRLGARSGPPGSGVGRATRSARRRRTTAGRTLPRCRRPRPCRPRRRPRR